jgi:hypothetical protein
VLFGKSEFESPVETSPAPSYELGFYILPCIRVNESKEETKKKKEEGQC